MKENVQPIMTLFAADVCGKYTNCDYPHEMKVTDEESLIQAVSRDYICAEFADHRRSMKNFLVSDCLAMDCDNDHSEDPAQWVTPETVAAAFEDVTFAVHFSRNHQKEKDGKPARPRFHVLFPIQPVKSAKQYAAMKQQVQMYFPAFDRSAMDAARFFYGTENPEVQIFQGSKTLTAFHKELGNGQSKPASGKAQAVIPQGQRNSTLFLTAARAFLRFGDVEETKQIFAGAAKRCSPPLEQKELNTIWNSAKRYYQKIARQEGYIPPEQYRKGAPLKPADYSDVGQAKVLAREYQKMLRYSPSTDFLVFNGSFWEESKTKAQGCVQELTDRQFQEAEMGVKAAKQEVSSTGAKKAESLTPKQKKALERLKKAEAYQRFVQQRRNFNNISSALKAAEPLLLFDANMLDTDPFLLNTPSGTCDLRLGVSSLRKHNPEDLITKQTAVDPSTQGMELWLAALDSFFQKDSELISYVQEAVGLVAIGKVFVESMIIAYGDGRNGKSTFWNSIAKVLGSYSGHLSADALTKSCKRNIKPELAEAKGKRLVIAAELESGLLLNGSILKQLCSTDEIFAEKKYKDPFSYTPSHTLVLYTNFLPRVGEMDSGTWRRLIVVPFQAKIEGNSDIKNYADFLFQNAGGAILTWIIQGAQRVIEKEYKLKLPKVVEDATQEYMEENDWLTHFLDDCCELDPSYTERSGLLYDTYRSYAKRMGEHVRNNVDFYTAVKKMGISNKKNRTGSILFGVRLKPAASLWSEGECDAGDAGF